MNLSAILQEYADLMNVSCELTNSIRFTKLNFINEHLSTKKFPYYCAYQSFDDGVIYDSELCQSCQKYWTNLCQLLDNPIVLSLLNKQQKEINEIKLKIAEIEENND